MILEGREGARQTSVIKSQDVYKRQGKYRSKMNPKSFVASITAWLARYRCQVIFCKAETTGVLIHEILYRELKEVLESGEENFGSTA